MKWILAILLVVSTVESAEAQSKKFGFRWPVRVVEGKKYDLNPLFSHWQTATNAVTNSPWMAVVGNVVGYNGGWIVEGNITAANGVQTHQKVLIRNPPAFEKDRLDAAWAKTKAISDSDTHYNGRVTPENGKQQEEFSKILAEIPNSNTTNGIIYRADFFALSTGKLVNGMPEFDFGLISQ